MIEEWHDLLWDIFDWILEIRFAETYIYWRRRKLFAMAETKYRSYNETLRL